MNCPPDLTWMDLAPCRDEDPDLFFPISLGSACANQIEKAKAVCGGCPVRESHCLPWALENLPDGVAGGLTDDERRSVKRRAQRLNARVDGRGRTPDPSICTHPSTQEGIDRHHRLGTDLCPQCQGLVDRQAAFEESLTMARALIASHPGLTNQAVSGRCGVSRETVRRLRREHAAALAAVEVAVDTSAAADDEVAA